MARKHVTQPGFVLKVKGEGMPQHNFPSEKGDLYVTLQARTTHRLRWAHGWQVTLPVTLSRDELKAVAALLPGNE